MQPSMRGLDNIWLTPTFLHQLADRMQVRRQSLTLAFNIIARVVMASQAHPSQYPPELSSVRRKCNRGRDAFALNALDFVNLMTKRQIRRYLAEHWHFGEASDELCCQLADHLRYSDDLREVLQ